MLDCLFVGFHGGAAALRLLSMTPGSGPTNDVFLDELEPQKKVPVLNGNVMDFTWSRARLIKRSLLILLRTQSTQTAVPDHPTPR